jgi:hypothetical protein
MHSKGGVPVKMVIITYNEAMDDEVMEAIAVASIKNYTKTKGAFGTGETSGTHMGNDIWPGLNNILYIACEEKESKELLSRVKDLRKNFGKEGIKAFLLPIEDLT